MSNPIGACPYPGCIQALPPRAPGAVCNCERRQPLAFCPTCAMGNREMARFCRRCRTELATPSQWAAETALARVNYMALAGSFRRPALAANNSVYAVNLEGHLETAWLKLGSTSRTLAELPPATAWNRAAPVDIPALGKTQPRWTWVGVHPGGVEAVLLNTGQAHTLHAVKGGAELAVNPVGSAAGFKGVAANGASFAFAERGEERVTLSVRSLTDDRPTDHPLALSGREVVGPVINRGLVALSSEEEIGVYDLVAQRSEKASFPRNFEPLMARRQGGVNVPPGSIPLTAERLKQGLVVYVVGSQNGIFGLLTVELQTGVVAFDPLGRGGSVTSNPDGSLSVAADGELRAVGRSEPFRERTGVQFGMPSSYQAGRVVSFGEEGRGSAHRVLLTVPGKGKVSELSFDDPSCTEVSCGAPLVSASSLAIPYFDASAAGGAGLKLAFWDFSV